MRRYYKIVIITVILFFSITSVNLNAAVGYSYSHSGQPIYSTVGLSVTNDGIYTIVSDNWKGIDHTKFRSPQDLFIYTETDTSNNSKDVIYIVDSGSNTLFIFDGDMNYQTSIDRFEVIPENFTDEQVLKMKTRTGNVGSYSSIFFRTPANLANFRSVQSILHENRTEAQKFYINTFTLSGVYRAVRPARDENGVIIRGEFQDLIYLSDKDNNQVVIIDANTYEVVQVVSSPTHISFSGKIFAPTRVTTDVTGRMFVISEGVYEGIMQIDYYGNFSSYVGVNYMSLSFWDIFWRRFMTDAQISLQQRTINTTFTSLAIDSEGFIYTTSRAVGNDDTKMIKRINPSGRDVLTRNGYHDPKGDLVYIRTGTDPSLRGPSRFSAITVNDYGVYTVADEKLGRLFTYDKEGNLLYISGGSGNELNNLNNPVAIQYQGENIIALDKGNRAVLRFTPTDIAVTINRAVKYHFDGNLEASSEEWKNVVAKNPNYEYAYVGIGKSLLNEKRYVEAMSYFQTGYSVEYYSQAYKLYRDEQIEKYFTSVMSVILLLGVAAIGYSTYRRIRYGNKEETGAGDE